MPQSLVLKNGSCEAVISSLGAELMEWRIGGRELVWNGDARWWPRRSPTLFPFCGWLNGGKFRAKGKEYPTEVHGFGRDTEFSLEQTGAASARMVLVDMPETRAQFPYAFSLEVSVDVKADGVSFLFKVSNPASEVLPYSLGFHPGFVWPFDGGNEEDYFVEFDAEDSPIAPKIIPGGLFTREKIDIPLVGKRFDPIAALKLQDSIFMPDTKSQRADFVGPNGRRIRVVTESFPNWVIWRKTDGAYLCIERWSGQGDPVGFDKEIIDKPGMKLLAPGAADTYAFHMSFI